MQCIKTVLNFNKKIQITTNFDVILKKQLFKKFFAFLIKENGFEKQLSNYGQLSFIDLSFIDF